MLMNLSEEIVKHLILMYTQFVTISIKFSLKICKKKALKILVTLIKWKKKNIFTVQTR